jgi:transposase
MVSAGDEYPRHSHSCKATSQGSRAYRRRYKIEIMFGRLKDWRRIHTRYDRCAHTFMSAVAIAATVIFWL